MWWSSKAIDFEAILRKHMDGEFSVFACGKDAPSETDIAAFERDIGYALPSDFRNFSKSQLGGLYVEVKEEVWPRAAKFEVGPFWSFLYGLAVYGFSPEIPEWMDMRRQADLFRRATDSTHVPFLKIMCDADLYCFGSDGRILRWEHETGEFRPVDGRFAELLDLELGELKTRKERKKAERAVRARVLVNADSKRPISLDHHSSQQPVRRTAVIIKNKNQYKEQKSVSDTPLVKERTARDALGPINFLPGRVIASSGEGVVRINRREFQFIDGSSKKFWAIELENMCFTVHFGRIGTVGQTKEKTFSSEDAAKREYERLIAEKTRNGYIETDASGTAATSTPVPKKRAATQAAPADAAAPREDEEASGRVAAADASSAVGPPSRGPGIVAHDMPIERHVSLPNEDWARVSWRHKPARLSEPRPFNFDACLKQTNNSAFGGWDYVNKIAKMIPIRLTKEEAWFWLNVLVTPHREWSRLEESLRAANPMGVPEDALVRARVTEVAGVSAWGSRRLVCINVPHVLSPFFAPIEIADLIIEWVQASARQSRYPAAAPQPAFILGFSAYVVPQMSEDERRDFRGALEQRYDAEQDPAKAALLLAFLSTVGGGPRLAAMVAKEPDKAWANKGWFDGPAGYLDMLAGLADEASFVSEARRLIGKLSSPSELRLWLAATEWRELDMAKDAVLAVRSKDEAAALARILALVEAPEAALPMLEVQHDSKAPAIAAEWLAEHPLHAAVGLVPAAMGQGKLADAARDQLHTMRRNGLAPLLNSAASHLTPEQAVWLQRQILDAVEEPLPQLGRAELPEPLHEAFADGKAFRPPAWLSVASLPPIKVQGKQLAPDAVEGVLRALKATPVGATSVLTLALKHHADRISLDTFAWKLFELWQSMGAPIQKISGRWRRSATWAAMPAC